MAFFDRICSLATLLLEMKVVKNTSAEREVMAEVPTTSLTAAVAPDDLSSVLASLQFRKLVSRFDVGVTVTRVWMKASRLLTLEALLTPDASEDR